MMAIAATVMAPMVIGGCREFAGFLPRFLMAAFP
jgi:hypothetical protein